MIGACWRQATRGRTSYMISLRSTLGLLWLVQSWKQGKKNMVLVPTAMDSAAWLLNKVEHRGKKYGSGANCCGFCSLTSQLVAVRLWVRVLLLFVVWPLPHHIFSLSIDNSFSLHHLLKTLLSFPTDLYNPPPISLYVWIVSGPSALFH